MAQIVSEVLNNPLLRAYFFYASLLVLKMLFMSLWTGTKRMKTKTFSSPEDIVRLPKAKVSTNENVERVRRAHLNDVENIPIFLVISLGYILTNPSYAVTLLLFRAYTLARYIHTFVYAIYVIPQPARAFSWGTGYAITIYMAVSTLSYFW
ncbi:microsomal glutathione S-transferase 1-like [Sitophilus oryzae]|uniref:Microsomal glutathione S-transferase 1 n=1 Tax=Sitophilus oryzae TaxID=7048 RepID=A0A6J2X427_SITOR|nr:microsomal glutathione S-transferase 1-like [Sitophilus oryzae]